MSRTEGGVLFRDDGVRELTLEGGHAPASRQDDDLHIEGEDGPLESPLPAKPAVARIGPARDVEQIMAELRRRLEILDREIQQRQGLEIERRKINRLLRAAEKRTK